MYEFITFTSICILSAVFIYNLEHKRNLKKLFIKEVDEGIKKLEQNVNSRSNKSALVKK